MRTEFLIWCVYFAAVQLSEGYPQRRIACPLLKLKNGRVRIRTRSFAHFSCNRGYILAGEKYSKCTRGVWDSPPPLCVRPACQKIQQLKNGIIHPSHRGAVLNFYCTADFVLEGSNRAYCVDMKWNTHMPTCLPTNVTPSLSCDFETEAICGWSHDLNHNFDWTRLNSRTPSGHLATGPSEDHTKGLGGNGYYMYIEGSTRNVNDTARLISPVYKPESGNTCLEFYYHMYGSGIGQLRVYLKKINESWDLKSEDAIFWKEGNHGNEWFRASVELGAVSDQFQVIFEGVRGDSFVSDIAIDDVKIVENCIADPSTTAEEELEATTFLYYSCTDKCNVTSLPGMSCSCSEDCYENNACCPDYIAVCVLGSDSEASDADAALTTEMDADLTTTTKAVSVIPTVHTGMLQNSTPSTLQRTTEETHLIETTTTSRTNPVQTTKLTSAPTTLKTSATVRSTKKVQTTVTPTVKVRRTTLPVRPTQKSETTISSTVKIRRTTSPTAPMPTEKANATKYFLNDMLTVPNEMTTEYVTVVEITEDGERVYTKEYPLDDKDSGPVLSDKVAPVHERPTPTNTTTVIAVLTVCFIVVGVLGLIFFVKRYTNRNCIGVRMRSGNGDSQSDVRFLTNDEILDFRLAKF